MGWSNGDLGGEQGGIQVLMTLVSLHSWASIYLVIEGALVTHKGMIQGFLGSIKSFCVFN